MTLAAGPAIAGAALGTSDAHADGKSDPKPGPTLDRLDTAVVFIDPQNEVLSEKGASWPAVGQSVAENKTVETMDRIFQAAKQRGFEVLISPHYFYPTDSGWRFNGALEASESEDKRFARRGAGVSRAAVRVWRRSRDLVRLRANVVWVARRERLPLAVGPLQLGTRLASRRTSRLVTCATGRDCP